MKDCECLIELCTDATVLMHMNAYIDDFQWWCCKISLAIFVFISNL